MKRSVFAFLLSILLVLLCIPAINILSAPDKSAIKLTEKSFLYNMDFVVRWTSRVLYPLGISIDPKETVIGKDNWLYLGDMYRHGLTTSRRHANDTDVAIAKNIGDAAQRWDTFLKGKGVKAFRIMIGPDKGSIYPEYMPEWAKPSVHNPTDALFAEVKQQNIFVDLRPPLLAAKKLHKEDLYFKTDTHWNAFGAGIAFQAFGQEVAKAAPEIKWPSEDAYQILYTESVIGQDLARFLRIPKSLRDQNPYIGVAKFPIKTTRTDFVTQEVLYEGGNTNVPYARKPLVVKSDGALNHKKVLWLRDSFGDSLAPLMAATFSDVLQLHWNVALAPDGNFAQLVEQWKPDYVFFTVVEREAQSLWGSDEPSKLVTPKDKNFQISSIGSPKTINDLASGPSLNEYQINGNDPYVDFAFSSKDARISAEYLNIDLTCTDGSPTVPLQLFWMEDGQPYYDEAHSTTLPLRTGQSLIDLKTIPRWPVGTDVKRIRVDFEGTQSCTHFTLGNPSQGVQN
jgi:hypothetical protein